jgi:murein DD-endopeptidase MepM/ murein hydrolase activator NlpD
MGAVLKRICLLGLLAMLGGLLSGCSLIGLGGKSYPKLPITTYVVKGGDTLYAIGRAYGVESGMIADLNDIDDPRELKIGQLLKVPYRYKPSRSSMPNASRPKAAIAVNKKPVNNQISKMSLGTAQRYVGKLLWPVPGGTYSSAFGRRWLSFHEGIDISAPIGRPVYAAHDGVVVYSDDSLRGYGNVVVVKGDGLLTVYGHNKKNRVKVGRRVRRGEQIADVGQTGKSTGPHLHFETRVKNSQGNNVAVDPLSFFKP